MTKRIMPHAWWRSKISNLIKQKSVAHKQCRQAEENKEAAAVGDGGQQYTGADGRVASHAMQG